MTQTVKETRLVVHSSLRLSFGRRLDDSTGVGLVHRFIKHGNVSALPICSRLESLLLLFKLLICLLEIKLRVRHCRRSRLGLTRRSTRSVVNTELRKGSFDARHGGSSRNSRLRGFGGEVMALVRLRCCLRRRRRRTSSHSVGRRCLTLHPLNVSI